MTKPELLTDVLPARQRDGLLGEVNSEEAPEAGFEPGARLAVLVSRGSNPLEGFPDSRRTSTRYAVLVGIVRRRKRPRRDLNPRHDRDRVV